MGLFALEPPESKRRLFTICILVRLCIVIAIYMNRERASTKWILALGIVFSLILNVRRLVNKTEDWWYTDHHFIHGLTILYAIYHNEMELASVILFLNVALGVITYLVKQPV